MADKTDWFQPFVSNTFTYDTNVFRLPSSLTAAEANALIDNVSNGGSKSDFINRLSAGARVRWYSGPHRVNMNLGVDDNIFVRNTALQNVSTINDASWSWDVSKAWVIQVGAEYQQYLAAFGNYVIPRKNMLTNMAYFGRLKYQFSPDWRAGAGVGWGEISNSVRDRRRNDVQELSGTVEVVYQNAAGNSAGIEYRHGTGFFPERNPAKFGFDEYDVDSAKFVAAYVFSAKTRFDGYVGYLAQTFAQAPSLDFSGGIWRLGVEWLPTDKTSIKISGWQNLEAYQDVASSYFVADGVKLLSNWAASPKLEIAGEFSWESRDYIGGGVSDFPENRVSRRVDDFFAAQVGVTYRPVEYLDAYLVYRYEKRKVNRVFFNYEYDGVGIGVVLRF
ncbi:MAG: outer membrane beta-barrel protein [Pseudomonadota bacterium]